jgi:hypothetical protein
MGGRMAEVALATMDEMGTAVGFCDAKEKEGVGNEEFVVAAVPETLEPEITEAPEEVEVPEVPEAVEGAGVEETAEVDEATS